MDNSKSVRISEIDYGWLDRKSKEAHVPIKTIVNLAIRSLRGEPDSLLTVAFKDKKDRR